MHSIRKLYIVYCIHVLYTVTVLCGILLPLNTCTQCGKKVLVMKTIFVLFMPMTLWELININVLHYYELWAHESTSLTSTVKNWCSKNVIYIEPCCFFYSRYVHIHVLLQQSHMHKGPC